MPVVFHVTTPETTHTATATMPGTMSTVEVRHGTRHRATQDRSLSAPVLTGLTAAFIAMLAGLTIELQASTPPSCHHTALASLTIVVNNLWAATELASPVPSPPALDSMRYVCSGINTAILIVLGVMGAFWPARGEASPLTILAIVVLELLGLFLVAAAAAVSDRGAQEASVEEARPLEEILTPEEHMQRAREMLERAEALLTSFGTSLHQLNWTLDALRTTAQDINGMFAWGWGANYQREDREEGYDDEYHDDGYYNRVDEDPEYETGYFDDYTEDETNDVSDEIEWAGEPAHEVHPEDAESDDGSSMPDLVGEGDIVIL